MREIRGNRLVLGALLAAGVVAGSAGTAHANTSTAFPKGSLIIPPGSAFQDDCGSVSAYGLIYDVLRANTWLAANGYNAITIFYDYLDTKQSPNRCTPTSLDSAPTSSTKWTDGCDVTNVSASLINNANHAAATSNIVTYNNSSKSDVYPQYPSQTVSGFTRVNYLGGPFIILQPDAATFEKLLDNTISAKDVYGNTIDFSPFRTRNSTQPAPPTSTCSLGTDHYVNVHVANAAFVANIGKAFQAVPPRLALLATDKNNGTGTVSNNILQGYLQNAGLTYTGANGCPPLSVYATSTSVCPKGATSGQIYDSFDFADLVANQLAAKDSSGKALYTMLWTPHWETTQSQTTTTTTTTTTYRCQKGSASSTAHCACGTTSTTCTSCAASSGYSANYCSIRNTYTSTSTSSSTVAGISTAEQTALGYISTFLNGQTGLAAECASISSYEGTTLNGSTSQSSSNSNNNAAIQGLQLQTCESNGAGACATGTTSFGLNRNSAPTSISSSGLALKNCSDPNLSGGAQCAYYSYPGDSFAQVGDYLWTAVTGHTLDYTPQSGSIYKPGVVPLISVVNSLQTSLIGTVTPYNNSGSLSTSALAARAMIVSDLSTRNVKDNTSGKANILYLAGHDETDSVAGTKLMLETLLQLGISTLPTITVTTEVSRNNPIDATIDTTDAILQGTYNLTTSSGSGSATITIPTYSLNGDYATFTFPAEEGHMRARATSTISTTSSSFSAGTIVFDAAGGIPDAIYAGCSTYFTYACRTVFTTIATGRNPAMHYLQSSELTTLGPLMGSNLDSTNQAYLMQRILAGDNSLTPTLYRPALGGVDHSTVAVIGTSSIVNGTRPTMAYFGATDGMIHAVCASTGGVCDLPGRELWAYLPRTSLSTVRYNTARIDGSPRVLDAYGDFLNTGTKSWRTILLFQTGFGDTTASGRLPAVYALDVSDPTTPTVLWEYSLANYASRGVYELGQGLDLSAGRVQIGSSTKFVAFAQTNNAGTGGAANVVTAIDMETGSPIWQQGYAFATTLRTGGTSIPPATGIPGGAVAVDKTGGGFVTDVVFGTLYGDLWDVNPSTGVSVDGASKPLLRFSTDHHSIGAPPAIYTNGGTQYAVITTGGYVDTYPNYTTWTASGNINYALAVSLNTPISDATINENKGSPDIAFKFSYGTGEAGYAQATVIGDQVFITTDTANVNNATTSAAYGLTGATGHVYSYNFNTGTQGSTVVVEGGASSVINSGNTVISGASDTTQALGAAATCSTCGTTVDAAQAAKVSRRLWLRIQ